MSRQYNQTKVDRGVKFSDQEWCRHCNEYMPKDLFYPTSKGLCKEHQCQYKRNLYNKKKEKRLKDGESIGNKWTPMARKLHEMLPKQTEKLLKELKKLYPSNSFSFESALYSGEKSKILGTVPFKTFKYTTRHKIVPDGGIIFMNNKTPILISEAKTSKKSGDQVAKIFKASLFIQDYYSIISEVHPYIVFCCGKGFDLKGPCMPHIAYGNLGCIDEVPVAGIIHQGKHRFLVNFKCQENLFTEEEVYKNMRRIAIECIEKVLKTQNDI